MKFTLKYYCTQLHAGWLKISLTHSQGCILGETDIAMASGLKPKGAPCQGDNFLLSFTIFLRFLTHFSSFLHKLTGNIFSLLHTDACAKALTDLILIIDYLVHLVVTGGNSWAETFQIVLHLYQCMLVTNCTGESSFSKLKLIKNYL